MTPNSENKRVWFITGASKGLGYAFTCAALKAGDKVVAVARTIDNLAKLKETYPETLLPLSLDVTDKLIGTVISGFLRFRVKIRFFPRTTTVFAPRTTNPIRIFRQRRLQEV